MPEPGGYIRAVPLIADADAGDTIAATIAYRWIAQAVAERRIGLIETVVRWLAAQRPAVTAVRRVAGTIDRDADVAGKDRKATGARPPMATAI